MEEYIVYHIHNRVRRCLGLCQHSDDFLPATESYSDYKKAQQIEGHDQISERSIACCGDCHISSRSTNVS